MTSIGLFGGTFDPVHFGHLRAALEVKEDFGLDQVILVPAALPPHKPPGGMAAAAHRLDMLRLAVEDAAGLNISDVELKRPGPSYTIDTVDYFKGAFPAAARFYLIMGLDAFLEIDTWKSYRKLLAEIAFIVINRPRQGSPGSALRWQILDDYLKTKIAAGYTFSASRSCYLSPAKQPIHPHPVTTLDISSTRIRELVKRGRTIRYLAPLPVVEFIRSKGLYL